jgi:hypothetical protein
VIVDLWHHSDRGPARLSAVRGALRSLAAALVLLVPVVSHAQELASTPLQAQFPLPAAPPPTYPIGAEPERAGSFLKGRLLLGVNLAHSLTPDEDLGSHWSLSP